MGRMKEGKNLLMEEKARKAINLTIELLEEILNALANEMRDDTIGFKLWKAISEADYAALALSMANNLVDFSPRLDEPDAPLPLGAALTKAQDLLKESLSLIEEDPKASYERIKRAVALMRSAGEALGL